MDIKEPVYRSRRLKPPELDTAISLVYDALSVAIYIGIYGKLIYDHTLIPRIRKLREDGSLLAGSTTLLRKG